jgi:hypothetical protein
MLDHMPDKFPFYCITETALPLIIWSVPPPLPLFSLSLSLSLRVTSLEQWVVCHTVSLPFTLNKYVKAKEEEL